MIIGFEREGLLVVLLAVALGSIAGALRAEYLLHRT